MAWALFSGRALLAGRSERRLDTERELRAALDNRLLLLFFGSARCPRCRQFEPRLRRFWSRLTEPAHVERPEQLGLVYLGTDRCEREHRQYLRDMPRTWMALPHRDAAFGRELAVRFGVSQLPAVVVLAPSGAVLVPDAVREIAERGPSCFQGWRQAAELLDRNFQERQEQEGSVPRSLTELLRRRKYRLSYGGEEEEEEERQEQEGSVPRSLTELLRRRKYRLSYGGEEEEEEEERAEEGQRE
ncbi:LOW QUALITY PROTEIN: nucleoredoxin-like protein 1 [Haemorhous mexicanus]|uniref:LOW QUALITY PROTEIN: nucleoredoxin-like protein 1 n=1 Tax=Haemorhous mexicanus TaxID=30427 RepID=UPI0028BEF21B|nr:LOW QUALITY PROTEIN: nucleoredoxin-like protein 1 [Haemorhous mexicanus]